MHGRPAEFLAIDFLADGGLDEGGAGKVQPAAFGHEQGVAEHGKIAASRHAVAHDRGDLHDPLGGDHRVITEDASEVIGIGKDVFLQRQENPGGIYKIKQRQPRPLGDHLGPDGLLAGHGKKCPGFHRRVVGNDHAQLAANGGYRRDNARGGRPAIFLVHVPARIHTALKLPQAGIDELFDTLPGGETTMMMLAFDTSRTAAVADDLDIGQ